MSVHRRFKKDAHYMIEGEKLERLWRVAKRLYKEERFKTDEMRDLAQEMDAMLEEAFEDERCEAHNRIDCGVCDKSVLYALWYGEECLTNVLAAPGLDAAQVRSIAVDSHEKVPLNYGDGMTPYQHAQALRCARVKVYERGKGRVIE